MFAPIVALAVLPLAQGFAPAVGGAFVAQRASMPVVMRAIGPTMSLGGGKGPSLWSSNGKFSLAKFLFGKPNLGGGGGGMMGGNGGNNGDDGAMKPFDSFDGDDKQAPLVGMAVMGVLKDLWDGYNACLSENPILTKACTSLVGFSAGDTLAQKFVSKDDAFDYKRLARMAAFGFLFHGTISHFFYNALDEFLPGTAALTVIEKVFIDQVLWAPIFTFVYLSWIGITSGMTIAQIGDKIKNDLIKGVVGSWTVWPLAHTINFKFVPTEQRLLYINSIQIGYNVFLSMLGASKK